MCMISNKKLLGHFLVRVRALQRLIWKSKELHLVLPTDLGVGEKGRQLASSSMWVMMKVQIVRI